MAEDDPVNSIYIRNLLNTHGYDVEIAKDGREVVEKWETGTPYDLILMDVQMPGTSGIEATAAIREQERLQGRSPIPIIALTAYSEGGERKEMVEAGITDYITKPVKTDTLMDMLSRSISYLKTHIAHSEDGRGPAGDLFSGSAGDEEAYMQRLLDEFADARDTLSQMLSKSLGELPKRLSSIENGLYSGDMTEAAENCHSLANVAGILLADRVRDGALKLERMLRPLDSAGEPERTAAPRNTAETPQPPQEALKQFETVSAATSSLIRTFRRLLRERL